ncbi:MAG: phosphatidylserine decarboxylase family protein [candidate division Zixibacteria bacterium]|nr:phosphatidylserine decarboxylase family protein [candidate division Zixibacteria bacterium]
MIAREGLIFIFIGLALTAAFMWGATRYSNLWLFALSVVFALLTLFTTFFFRDPDRTCPDHQNLLVAPADGKIIDISEIPNHPFIGGAAVKISIFLSVLDVHVNRIPATGVIDFVKYNPGKFFAAYEEKASELNEQTEIGMTAISGHKLVFKQIAGIIARRIVCRLNEKDTVTAGERFGMIRFGSRTDLIIPADSRLEISLGDQVYGGRSVIGYLNDTDAVTAKEAVKEKNAEI